MEGPFAITKQDSVEVNENETGELPAEVVKQVTWSDDTVTGDLATDITKGEKLPAKRKSGWSKLKSFVTRKSGFGKKKTAGQK